MLTDSVIESILSKLPSLKIGVVGDLFLDQYLELDHRLTEPSIETGLDAYQVASVRNVPGAAGTILNNLAALGVGTIKLLSFVGADGRGYDLQKELHKRRVDVSHLLETPLRATPTYTKPMLSQASGLARELNRIDIKNLTPTPGDVQLYLLEELPKLWRSVDAVIVLDQVSVAETGVVTTLIRAHLKVNFLLAETQLKQQQARDSVPAVFITIGQGQTIIRYGDQVTAFQLEEAQAVGLQKQRSINVAIER